MHKFAFGSTVRATQLALLLSCTGGSRLHLKVLIDATYNADERRLRPSTTLARAMLGPRSEHQRVRSPPRSEAARARWH